MKKLLIFILFFYAHCNAQMIFGFQKPLDLQGTTIVFVGNSITNHVGASDNAHSWTTLLSSLKGATEVNLGISGQVLEKGVSGCRTEFDSTTIPAYTGQGALFIDLGVNDIGINIATMTPAGHKARLGRIVDYAHTIKGWPYYKIILNTPSPITDYSSYVGICTTSTPADDSRALAYVTAIIEVAKEKHCILADVYHAFLNQPNPSSLLADGIHPNDAGHAVIANYLNTLELVIQ